MHNDKVKFAQNACPSASETVLRNINSIDSAVISKQGGTNACERHDHETPKTFVVAFNNNEPGNSMAVDKI